VNSRGVMVVDSVLRGCTAPIVVGEVELIHLPMPGWACQRVSTTDIGDKATSITPIMFNELPNSV